MNANTKAALAHLETLIKEKVWGTSEDGHSITMREIWKEGEEVVRDVTHHYGDDTAPLRAAVAEAEAKHLADAATPSAADVTVGVTGNAATGEVNDLV